MAGAHAGGAEADDQAGVRLAVFAMGCRFELVLEGADAVFLRAAGEEAVAEIERAHALLSVFERGSVVSRINAAAGSGVAVAVNGEVLGLFELCERVRGASGGAFDAAVGREVERAGFRRSPPGGAGPSAAGALPSRGPGDASGRGLPAMASGDTGGFGRLIIDRASRSVALRSAGASVDLGAVGKGFAVDLAVSSLRAAGVEHGLVHAGTSTAGAIGRRADGSAWRVAVPGELGPETGGWVGRGVGRDGAGVVVADVSDGALSVSGSAEQAGHVVDPRRGGGWDRQRDEAGGAASVSRRGVTACVGASAAACDAWSTALYVLGERPATLGDEIGSGVETADGWRFGGEAGRLSVCDPLDSEVGRG